MSNIKKFEVDLHDFIKDPTKHSVHDSLGITSFVIQKQTGQKCFAKQISLNKKNNLFYRTIELLSQYNHPAFASFIGYSINKKKGTLYFEAAENGSIYEYIKKNRENKNTLMDDTHKLIISYGISCAMEYLHSHNIVNRDLKTNNILLDSKLYPKISDFCCSVNTDLDFDIEFTVKQTTIANMAPEFLDDYIKYNRTKPIDVFSYAMILYEIWTGKSPYSETESALHISDNIMKNIRPKFPSDSSINKNIINLISRCWDQDPKKRPTFTEICDLLETDDLILNIDSELFNSYRQTVRQKYSSTKMNL